MLSAISIRRLIEEEGMIEGYLDLENQLQPNGFDFTVASCEQFWDIGPLTISEEVRTKPVTIPANKNIFADHLFGSGDIEDYVLEPHAEYVCKLNERIKLPTNVAALARPRSSFIRVGASIHTGVWDSGYEGHSTILLKNGPNFIHLKPNTRIVQMVFFELDAETNAYSGIYQGETL